MTMFQEAIVVKDAVMVDVLAGYLNTHLGGRVSAEYEPPFGQGRIGIQP